MVRSMYSGVSGMKAHQTRLDVIGNNISNVNTYGYKSSRATFRDMYYQSIRSASGASNTLGGINPSQVGYGANISTIDLLMTPSTNTNTGRALDLALSGEGFFQVQDADGNKFYTRAGNFTIDPGGNLVDANGYFVLGVTGNPAGKKPSSNKINVRDSLGTVPPNVSTLEDSINNVKYNFSSSNNSTAGNINLSFVGAKDLPIGKKAEAVVASSTIVIRLNEKEKFASVTELETAVNDAITAANNGVEHAAGRFTISMDPNKFTGASVPAGGLTGAEIVGENFGWVKGTLATTDATHTDKLFNGFTVKEVGDHFSGTGQPIKYSLEQTTAFTNGTGAQFTLKVEVGNPAMTYQRVITQDQMDTTGSVVLQKAGSTDEEDSVTMNFPPMTTMLASGDIKKKVYIEDDKTTGKIPKGYDVGQEGPELDGTGKIQFNTAGATALTRDLAATTLATASHQSNDLGLGKSFKLNGGTEGGTVQMKDLVGVAIGADGIIVINHSILGQREVGRIDLACFDNPSGMSESGNSYYAASANSGAAGVVNAGTSGSSAIKSSSLELSNVDLSQEFADMITTQRGFQANSRLITVSDTLLEELVNLKR